MLVCPVKSLHLCFIGGADYNSVPQNIIIPAGDTSGVLNVTLRDDNIFEFTETFSIFVHVDAASLKISINDGIVVVIIQDDDRKC